MATINISVPRSAGWPVGSVLELWVGTENATNLATSTPSGGRKVMEQPAWTNAYLIAGLGTDDMLTDPLVATEDLDLADAVFPYHYHPVDKCCWLPVGVKVRDAAGNESAGIEMRAKLADPPVGARNLQVHPTANPREAELTWTQSPDV